MSERGSYFSDVPNSGIKYTGFLIEDKGTADGHGGFLFSGVHRYNQQENPAPKEITRAAGSTRGLFNSQEFLFD